MQDKKLEAKKLMLKGLRKEMMDLMGEERGDLKDILGKKLMKVTVASDSKEGLEKGLSKAEEILKKKMGEKSESSEEEYKDEMSEEPSEEKELESEEEKEMEDEESPEMLQQQLLELQEKIKAKSK